MNLLKGSNDFASVEFVERCEHHYKTILWNVKGILRSMCFFKQYLQHMFGWDSLYSDILKIMLNSAGEVPRLRQGLSISSLAL